MKRRHIAIGLFGIAALSTGVFLATRTRSNPDPPIASSGGTPDFDVVLDGIPHWRQNDPAWGREPIGGSDESMAAAGCTVTCVAMALSSMGHAATPLELCRDLKARGGFTRQGLVIWDKIGDITRGTIHVEFPPLTHDAIEASLHAGRPVITKILLGGRVAHWVLLVGKQAGEYLAVDPLSVGTTVVRLSTRSERIHAICVLRKT